MAWAVTLIVKACDTMAPLEGALVSDGIGGGYTDVYGQFIAVIDDAYTGYVVNISKTNYNTRAFTFARSQIGTPQNTCLTVYIPPPPGTSNGCFIVTAASGSDQSPEVTGMRALRDRVAAAAPLAGHLIDAIYHQYWQFSPAIADQIRDSDSARMGVMALVVRPLFAWYQMAGELALGADAAALAEAERELRSACPRYLGPARIGHILSLLRRGEPLPASAPELARQMAPHLQQALALPLVEWAIFEPLQRTWNGSAERRDMRAEIAEWLARAPLDTLEQPAAERLAPELASLAALLAFDPVARLKLGARLAAAWPAAATALQQAQLVAPPG